MFVDLAWYLLIDPCKRMSYATDVEPIPIE